MKHRRIIESALLGAITLSIISSANVAKAQQGKPRGGDGPAAQSIPLDQLPIDQRLARDPEADPNLPGVSYPMSDLTIKLRWNFFHGDIGSPALMIVDPRNNPRIHGADYLGWNDEGSLLNADNGRIYVWNSKKNTITERYQSFADIPTSVLASLKNSASKQDYLASRGIKPAKPQPAQATRKPVPDQK